MVSVAGLDCCVYVIWKVEPNSNSIKKVNKNVNIKKTKNKYLKVNNKKTFFLN